MIFFSHSSESNTYFAINFCTGLFLLGGFINNRKTSFGAILFTDILYSLFKYSNKYFFFLDTQGTELKSVFFRFLIRSYIPTCLYRQFVITQKEFSQSYPVSDVGDLTEIIFTFIILSFSEGSQFVLLVGVFSYIIVYVTEPSL